MEKPKGTKILAIIILILSTYGILSGIISFFTMTLYGGYDYGGYDQIANQIGYSKTYFVVSSIASLIIQIIFLTGAIGLIKYKEWGRKTIIVAAIVSLLYGIFGFIYSFIQASNIFSIIFIFSFILLVAWNIFLLIYLNRKSVKEATT